MNSIPLDTSSPELSDKKGQSGQVFFEFILLLLVLMLISYGMLYGVNGGVSKRWQAMVHLVTKVEGSAPPQFP